MRQLREDIEAQMKLGCVNTVCRKDVKQMEQINCESVLWAASSSVCAQPKQGAPWQFNNLQCHLGAITLPLGTVIVIISGQNTFSVLITRNRLCSSLLGTVSPFFERDVISYYSYLYFQPVSSSYLTNSDHCHHQRCLSCLLLETDSRLTFQFEPLALTIDLTCSQSISTVVVFFTPLISVSVLFVPPTHTHYEAAVTANNNLFSLWNLK